MHEPPAPPAQVPAGWYPSPDGAPVMRWWNGAAWSEATTMPTRPPTAGSPRTPLANLGLAVRVGIAAVTVLLLLGVALEVYGILSMTAYMEGAGTIRALHLYDELKLVWAVAFFATFFPVGIFWMIWQYRAAANAGAGLLRRGPAMHAWSWAIPVAAVWFPYQNISDLHRVTGIRTPGLPVWWLFWLASALLSSVADYFATLESPEIQPLLVGMLLLLVSNLLLVAAAPLAWMVVARLTPPLDAR